MGASGGWGVEGSWHTMMAQGGVLFKFILVLYKFILLMGQGGGAFQVYFGALQVYFIEGARFFTARSAF